jgi:hypothetical protein
LGYHDFDFLGWGESIIYFVLLVAFCSKFDKNFLNSLFASFIFIQVTSNMHAYLHRSDVEVFEYDINHLMHAASVFSTFSFIIPAVFWITSKCMNMEALSLVEWTCLYGYSLTPFLPAVVLCVIPFGILSWVFLLAAAVVSGSLILRNVAAPMLSTDVGQAKAPPLILAILGTHLIFFLVVKFTFFHHSKK